MRHGSVLADICLSVCVCLSSWLLKALT